MVEPFNPAQATEALRRRTEARLGSSLVTISGGSNDATEFFTKPGKTIRIGGQDVASFTVKPRNQRDTHGPGSATILDETVHRNGTSTFTEAQLNAPGDQYPLNKVKAIRFREEVVNPDGTRQVVEKTYRATEWFDIGAPAPELRPVPPPAPSTNPSPTPESPRRVLSILGLKGLGERARELAEQFLEKKRVEAGRKDTFSVRNILHEWHLFRRTEFYKEVLTATNNPLTEESLTRAETKAAEQFTQEKANMTTWQRAKTNVKEYFRTRFGVISRVDELTLLEVQRMRQAGELTETQAFAAEDKAMARRFDSVITGDVVSMQAFIRENMGEKVAALDPSNAAHAPVIDGIKNLIRSHINNTAGYQTEVQFQTKLNEFIDTLTPATRQEFFPEAEMFSTSIFRYAQELRVQSSHDAGMADINSALDQMEFRVGVAAMGEVTQLDKTTTDKWTERVKKILNFKGNDYVVGSGVSIALSLAILPQTVLRGTARVWGGGIAGGVITGTLAYTKEYSRLKGEYRKFLRQKEAGLTPNATFFEPFGIKLRTTDELIGDMSGHLYESNGKTLKHALSEVELRKSFATLADARARKLGYEWKELPVGLINLGPKGMQEQNRTRLDTTIAKVQRDLAEYVSAHGSATEVQRVLGGANVETVLRNLTAAQQAVLQHGISAISTLGDPIKSTLGEVAAYAPEIEILRRRGLFKAKERLKREGLDSIMDEFERAAKIEAVKKGAKAGTIGLFVGAGVSEALQDVVHLAQTGDWEWLGPYGSAFNESGAGHFLFGKAEALVGQELAGGHIALPDNFIIDPQGNLDFTDADGIVHQNVIPQFTQHLAYDDHGMITEEAKRYVVDNLKDDNLAVHFPGTVEYTQTGIAATSPHRLPGFDRIEDANGVLHTVDMKLPSGATFIPDADGTPDLQIAGHGRIDLQFDHKTGELTNFDAVKAEVEKFGWHIKHTTESFDQTIFTEQAQHKVIDTITTPSSGEVDTSTLEWHARDWDARGAWGEIEDRLAPQDLDHDNAATNAVKNLLRGWQLHFEGDANGDGIPDNMEIEQVPGYTRIIHYRDTLAGDALHKQEVDWRLPGTQGAGGDTVVELPKVLFSDDSMAQIAHMADAGAKHFEELRALHPDWTTSEILHEIGRTDGEALRIAAKIGYKGMEEDIPTPEEIRIMMRELSGPGEPVISKVERLVDTPPLETNVATTLHEYEFLQPTEFTELANQVVIGPANDPWPIPIIGIPTEGPRVTPPRLQTPRQRGAASGSGFHSRSGSGFNAIERLTLETQQFYRDRLSDRLKNNPHSNLDPKVEVPDYIRRQQPEYTHELESYLSQEGMSEPMDEHADAIVTIPVFTLGEGQQIQNALDNYYMQINKATNKQSVDPSKLEVIIFLNHPKPMRVKLENDIGRSMYEGAEERVRAGKPEVYDTEEVIKQFRATHPELRIRVMKKEFNERQLWGNIIKPLYDVALMRAMKRTNPFRRDPVIITNDIDVVRMSPTYIRDILKKMDMNEVTTWRDPRAKKIDGMVGSTDMAKEIYQKIPGFLTSQRFFHFLESVNHPLNRSTQGRNTILRASTYAAIGGVNPNTDNGADGELERIISFARGGDQTTLPYLPTAYLETDPRRELETWIKGIPYMYNWNSWAAMDVYGKNWKDRFTKPVENPSQIDKTMLELEINETIKNWFGGSINPTVQRAMTFVGLKPGDYHIVKTTDEQGRPWDKIEVDSMANLSANLKKYIDEKRWEVANRRRDKLMNQPPISRVTEEYHAEYINYEEFNQIYEDIFLNKSYGSWEPAPGRTNPVIIDLGAHIGMSVLYWKSKIPGAKITAVEANPDTTEVLKRNIKRNRLSNVTVVQGAASSKAGNVDLFKPKGGVDFRWGDFVGGRPVDASKYDVVQVPSVKLSKLIKGPTDLLKLDIEGSELEVLKEAEPKLGQVKEIIMEFHNEPENPSNSITECLQLLNRQGYQVNVTLFDKPVDVSSLDLSQRLFFMISAKRP